MSMIGRFTASRDGGYQGTIRTLTIQAKTRIVPNDDKAGDNPPDYRFFIGQTQIGASWPAQSGGEEPKAYQRVVLDDPMFPEPIRAALFEEDNEARLVWTRPRPG
jgi:uncharacterized protein (DUF736 family)